MSSKSNIAIKWFILTLVSFTGFAKLNATHIVGGELYYEYLGNNNYKITLDYFIDCINGNPGAIQPDLDGSNFAVFNGKTNQRISSFDRTIAAGLPKRVSETNYKCIITKPNACVDRYQFSFVLRMPPIEGGYIVAFQRCCRNNSITNLLNPGLTGSTFWTKIEDLRTQNWNNTSAHFKELPPNFLCTNAPLVFDHSAIDADGDSLVYELFHPYNSYQGNSGARPGSPKPVGSGFLAPPFPVVNFANGYSKTKQIDATNNFIINPTTGLLNFTPTQTGQFVVGILVKEYRNGVLVGTTRRDFQFNVSDCTFEVVSSFFAPNKSCAFTVNFNNNSKGTTGLSYSWDFGEKDDPSDQSNQTFPSYTYDKAGNYTIQLIAKTNSCADTYSRVVYIVDPIYPNLGPDDTLCMPFTRVLDANLTTEAIFWNTGEIGRRISVNKGGEYIATYSKEGCSYKDSVYLIEDLDFPELREDTIICNNESILFPVTAGGPFVNYWWSTGARTTQINVTQPGNVDVLIETANGCFYKDSFNVEQRLPPPINLTDAEVCPGFSGNFNAGIDEVTYMWSTGETSASISANQPGPYSVVIFDGKCYNSDTAILSITDIGPYGLPNDTAFCNKVLMLLNPGNQFVKYDWSTGETSPTITVGEPGSYKVILSSKEGCIVEDSMKIGLNPLPNVNLGPDTTVCQAINLVLDPGPGVSFTWQDETTEKTHTAYESGVYHVKVVDHNGCINADTIQIHKDPNALPSDLYMPNAFSPNGDGLNDFYPSNQYQDIGVEYNLRIFTRWGEKLEDFDSPSFSWDGNYKGEPMAEGVYIYLVNWLGCDNKRRQKSGNVTLLK